MNKSFIKFLDLVKYILLEGNTSNLNNEAKKILCTIISKYVKIHACHNDFILYTKEIGNLNERLRCVESRYKLKKMVMMMMLYEHKGSSCHGDMVPTNKSRFKRLFYVINELKNIRLHVDERKYDGKILHIADSLQWKKLICCFRILATIQETIDLDFTLLEWTYSVIWVLSTLNGMFFLWSTTYLCGCS